MSKYIDNDAKLQEPLDVLSRKSILGFDIESNGLDPLLNKVLLLQVGDEQAQYVFDIYKLGTSIYKVLDILKNENVAKVAHNAKFDYGMIKGNFGVDLPNIRCTMIGEQLLIQGKQKRANLAAVLDKHLGVSLPKGEQKSFINMPLGKPFTAAQLQYAGDDVKYLIPLYKKLQTLLNDRGMKELSELEYETIRVTADLELNGIFLDKEKWSKLQEIAEEGAAEARKELDTFFADYVGADLFGNLDINYNAPEQVGPILEKITGASIQSTAEPFLKKIKHPVIDAMLTYREHKKKITTYGDKFFEKHASPVDGRVHSDFQQLFADSGRFASRKPNMTNIPKEEEYRAAFVAQDPEYRIVSADYGGQELRLMAHISQEPKFLHAIKNNMDLHCYSASLVYNIPYIDFFNLDENGEIIIKDDGDPDIKEDMKRKYRTPAKSLTFGLMYGIGPKKLADEVGISIAEAKKLMNKYFATFPSIKRALDNFVKDAKKNHYALSPLDGRRRDLSTFDWDNSKEVAHAMNIAKNLPFQGAGASVTKLAMCRLKRVFDKEGWDARIINVIHDEILVEVHKDEAEQVAKLVKDNMIEAFRHFAPSVPMAVSPDIASCWMH